MGVGSELYSVLYNWLIPNRNVEDGIGIVIRWVRGSGVKGAKGPECRSDGWLVFDWCFDGCGGGGGGGMVGRSGGDAGCCDRLGCTGILLALLVVPTVV